MKAIEKALEKMIERTLSEPDSDTSDQSKKNHGKCIVVLDRGWVFAGDLTEQGDTVRIENAKNIRVWGTTKGIGQLRAGPTESTKFDDYGVVVSHKRSLILFTPCLPNSSW